MGVCLLERCRSVTIDGWVGELCLVLELFFFCALRPGVLGTYSYGLAGLLGWDWESGTASHSPLYFFFYISWNTTLHFLLIPFCSGA